MADSHVCLEQAIIATLARAVKKENDRPSFLLGEIGGDKDLVTIAGAGDTNGPIEKSSLNAGKNRESCRQKK
jgi:hypothetical protein